MRVRLRIFIIFLVVGVVPFVVLGEQWTIHSPFAGTQLMAETRGRVYFSSLGALYAYDKVNDETLSFNTLNGLNDVDVVAIKTPFNSNFVAVAYSSGNIDLIYDEGDIINLPDIKDARRPDKGINSIAFNADASVMLVATEFGIVRFSITKKEVIDSGFFDGGVELCGFFEDSPVAFYSGTLFLFESMTGANVWKSPVVCGTIALNQLINAAGSLFGIVTQGDTSFAILFQKLATDLIGVKRIATTSTRYLVEGNTHEPLVMAGDVAISFLDTDFNVGSSWSMPATNDLACFTANGGPANLWIGSAEGIENVDITVTPVYTYSTVTPGSISVKDIHLLRSSPSGKIYAGNRGNSNIFGNTTTGIQGRQAIVKPSGEIIDITPQSLTLTQYATAGSRGPLLDQLFMREDPNDPDVYYSGSLHEGLYVLNVDGEELAHYYDANSRLSDYWGVRAQDALVDNRGNLWVLSEREPGFPSLMRLSAEGKMNGNDVTLDHWKLIDSSAPFYAARDAQLEMSANGRYLYAMGNNDLMVHDTKGTDDIYDDETFHIVNFNMADGSGYARFTRFNRIMEDTTGALWVATDQGVFYVPDPSKVANNTVDIVKPKVARNDGTDLADYLLSTQCVYGMACDENGNIWFVTRDSGIFLTTHNGTRIVANYNTTNAPLTSNSVFSVATNGTGDGKVFFGTGHGMLELVSEYAETFKSYENLEIYPNPVKPEYYGDVTVEGLPSGSRVKILSSSGRLVAEIDSEGSTARWNARTSTGRRVPAGVYNVMVSSSEKGNKSAGKIVILR